MKPDLSPDVLRKLEEISRSIRTPQEELISMILHVGTKALAEALKRDGNVEFPLTFEISPTGRRAVFIRESDFLQVINASQLVRLKDAPNDLVSWII